MSQTVFVGLDLTSSDARPTACVGLDERLDLAFAGFVSRDADLLALVTAEGPRCTAIDAPLTLPRGLCCLEEGCNCCAGSGTGRECERELARLGIPCYFTTKRSIIKGMVYRGVKMRAELERRGCCVIEVYPYASKVCLWGRPIPPKSKPEGLAFLHDGLARLMPGLRPYVSDFNHDLCDAAIAAYTAYLYHQGRTRRIGNAEEGTIEIPDRQMGGPEVAVETGPGSPW